MHCTHHPEVCGGKLFKTERKIKYGKFVPQLTQQAATAAAAKKQHNEPPSLPLFFKGIPPLSLPFPVRPDASPPYTGTEIRQALVERGGGSNDDAETMGFISGEECAKKRTFLTPRAARKIYLRGKALAGIPNIGPE